MNEIQEGGDQAPLKKKMTIPEIFALVFFSDVLLTVLVVFVLLINYLSPPVNAPLPKQVVYSSDMTVYDLATTLEKNKLIQSAFVFEWYVRLSKQDRRLTTGTYHFTEPENMRTIVQRIVEHSTGQTSIRITIPEGLTRKQMAAIYTSKLPNFDEGDFLSKTESLEGYLFPDTYMFDETATATDVIQKMSEVFTARTQSIFAWKTEEEIHRIITMASILEEEGKTLEDRKVIAGILERRIRIGMRLQVDATFLYINGKNTYDLTSADLEIDSPYNTYKHSGLPPGPISSPGLSSIQAALNPDDRGYLYYLTDKSGNFYYAKTHEVHVENKRKYLHL